MLQFVRSKFYGGDNEGSFITFTLYVGQSYLGIRLSLPVESVRIFSTLRISPCNTRITSIEPLTPMNYGLRTRQEADLAVPRTPIPSLTLPRCTCTGFQSKCLGPQPEI